MSAVPCRCRTACLHGRFHRARLRVARGSPASAPPTGSRRSGWRRSSRPAAAPSRAPARTSTSARMQVARSGHPEAALQRRAEVGDDVAEQVVGHDHVGTATGPAPAAAPAHRCRGAAPRSPGYCGATSGTPAARARGRRHRVALVGHADRRQPVARAANSNAWRTIRCTPLQVLSSSWIATSSSVPGLEPPADADVEAFGVLAEHDEVDVGGVASFSGQSRSSSSRTGR